MTNLSYIRSLHKKLDDMSRSEIECIVYKIGYMCPEHGNKPLTCRECSPCIKYFLDREFVTGEYKDFYENLESYVKEKFYREPVKTDFIWDDMLSGDNIIPCDYCTAINKFPLCDDGATSSACNHCEYNIYRHIDFEVK